MSNVQITKRLIRALLNDGYALAVRCMEEGDVILGAAPGQRESDVAAAVLSVDGAVLCVHDLNADKRSAMRRPFAFWLVQENGEDVIVDYTWPRSAPHFEAKAEGYAERAINGG